jgi:asparagine synthase (glutamine-hydrolysing)
MCGIFAYSGKEHDVTELSVHFGKLQHRGPDYSEIRAIKPDLVFGFHRLAVNGLDTISNQPMYLKNCWLVANAEVYNYKKLAAKYRFELTTHSDCEIIIHMYRRFGIERTLKELDAEFAFALYDTSNGQLFAARDHLGVRGLYVGRSQGSDSVAFASEAKGLTFMEQIRQFPPGSWWSAAAPEAFHTYFQHQYPVHDEEEGRGMYRQIRYLLSEAVKKRLMSDRPIGSLLSGGLDSSLVSALVMRHRSHEAPVETFSIGMPGSPDLEAAQEVADFIGSTHHSVELKEEDFLKVLEETIYVTGSFDVTTIRASVGHMLISRYVRDHSDVKVLFTGETIDEMGSYLYFQNAPSPAHFQDEAVRLLKDIHFFDMLRGDRSISSAGLEARVPFSDQSFLRYYMGIDPKIRMFDGKRIEKHPLRRAFAEEKLLPDSVLWRRKNGFSDSVSQQNRSWSVILQEYIDERVSQEEFIRERTKFHHNPPQTKEAYYYRKVFEGFYGNQPLTPYTWLPKWCGEVVDPSARVLPMYAAD